MEKLRIEKIRTAWNEFESVLQQVEQTGNMSKLDAELLKSKLLATYEALTSTIGSDTVIPQSGRSDRTHGSQDIVPGKEEAQHSDTQEGKIKKEETGPVKSTDKKDKSTHAETPKPEVLKEVILEKLPETVAQEPEPVNRIAEVIGEKLRGNRKFVHDELAEKVQAGRQDLTSALQSKPIENIEKAIGINDKFLFIKELFRNNGQLYKETVEKLDTSKNLDEALSHIRDGFSWDEKDPVVQKFTDIIRRRHQ
jgi:hypothetical protein